MDLKNAAQWIRDNVIMQNILDLYGYHTKHGFMVCPFHGDRDASLRVYDGSGGWHCFGCGRGGSVIDFVMEHENCNFKTAVIAIDKNLHLNLTDTHEDPEEADANLRVQEWLDDFVRYVYETCQRKKEAIEDLLRRDLIRVKDCEYRKTMEPPDLTAEEYDFMAQWKEVSEYNEYRIEKIDQFMEEVAAWRRKWRKAR